MTQTKLIVTLMDGNQYKHIHEWDESDSSINQIVAMEQFRLSRVDDLSSVEVLSVFTDDHLALPDLPSI